MQRDRAVHGLMPAGMTARRPVSGGDDGARAADRGGCALAEAPRDGTQTMCAGHRAGAAHRVEARGEPVPGADRPRSQLRTNRVAAGSVPSAGGGVERIRGATAAPGIGSGTTTAGIP